MSGILKSLAAVVAVGTVATVTACGGDNGTSPQVRSLVLVSGDQQSAAPGEPLASPLVVRVEDDGGSPVAGVRVSWTVTSAPQGAAGAELSSQTATTGTNGEASALFTLGDAEGTYGVTAAISGSSVVFTATATIFSGQCATVLDLAAGEDTVVAGATAVSCVRLPAHDAGAEYEVVVTTMAQTLGFSPMELRVGPPSGSGSVQPPVEPVTTATSSRTAPSAAVLTSSDLDLADAYRAGQSAWDLELRGLERPLLPAIRSLAARPAIRLSAVPVPGDTMRFNFSRVANDPLPSCVTSDDFPNAPDSVTAVVRSVSAKAVVLEDTVSEGVFTVADYDQIAQNFDDVIYEADSTYFGAPGDIDANGGRVLLLYSPGVNRMSEDYSQGFIAGFFCPLDLGLTGGNGAEMFYLMVPDPDGTYTPAGGDGLTKEQVLRFTDNTVAHEFQHMINAQIGGGGAQDVWLNEGLSHLAEEVVGHALSGFEPGTEITAAQMLSSPTTRDAFNKYYVNNWFNLTQYLKAPADTAALLVSTDPLDFNTFRFRGAAWSFVRYLLDRFADGTATEAQKSRALIQDASSDSRQAIANVFGRPFDRLASEWNLTWAVEDRADVAVDPELQITSYRVRDLYESAQIGPIINPPVGGYPLSPLARSLSGTYVIDADLFTATARFVTLSATTATSGTELRLVQPGTGDVLSGTVQPRIVIVRTK